MYEKNTEHLRSRRASRQGQSNPGDSGHGLCAAVGKSTRFCQQAACSHAELPTLASPSSHSAPRLDACRGTGATRPHQRQAKHQPTASAQVFRGKLAGRDPKSVGTTPHFRKKIRISGSVLYIALILSFISY
jgi:hypothetical protein